jgi:D-alanyl-D-alanine carboxypeptidase
MATPRTNTPKAASKEETGPGGWNTLFIGGVATVALSFIVFVFVVADKFGDSGGDGSPPAAGVASTTPTTGGAAASSTAGGTSPAQTTPSGTNAAGADTSPLVRCGDVLAPLDKQHRLGSDCAPADLVTLPGAISSGGQQLMRTEAAAALQEMFAAAAKDSLRLFAASSYRSYQQQEITFQQNVASGGREYAERTSAHAGHSEHQLGTTTDVASPTASFEALEGTPEAKWLADNSWKYGFVISYPAGKEGVTGYAYEPWHVRWVGKDVASKVRTSGLTLHEYLLK